MQDEIALRLSPQEINVALEALGNLPFVRVYSLIDKIQAQAAAELERASAAGASQA